MRLLQGDCVALLPELEAKSVHAVVTDPPYGIGFLGADWDAALPDRAWAVECLRVLKPGGHLLAFGGTRTFHRLVTLIEEAGFVIRDTLCWIHTNGLPKSRALGAQWKGFGTGLKPAVELIVLARRPPEGSVESNVARHGVGALNIEACRIPFANARDRARAVADNDHGRFRESPRRNRVYDQDTRPRASWAPQGRFPANVLVEAVAGVGPAEGVVVSAGAGTHTGALPARRGPSGAFSRSGGLHGHQRTSRVQFRERAGDGLLGPVTRFFVIPKASRKERDAGLGGDENTHPTVKPIELMRHLVRLVAGKPGPWCSTHSWARARPAWRACTRASNSSASSATRGTSPWPSGGSHTRGEAHHEDLDRGRCSSRRGAAPHRAKRASASRAVRPRRAVLPRARPSRPRRRSARPGPRARACCPRGEQAVRPAHFLQASVDPDARKAWEPANCVRCPRKGGLLANDRCLELQEAERCWCPNAASSSVRAEVEVEETSEHLRRGLLAQGRPREQTCPARLLVGLHGKKGHGKTTVAERLVATHGFERIRFAAPLKEAIGAHLFGMTEAQTDGFLKEAPCVDLASLRAETLAEQTVALLFGDAPAPYGMEVSQLVERWRLVFAPLFQGGARLYTPREVMQVVGGGARTHLSPTVWIDLWRNAYLRSSAPRVVVDDVRYPNEKQALEQLGGQVWRLVRTDVPDSGDRDPSEVACDHLPDAAFAQVLRRATGVPALQERVDALMAEAPVARAG